MKKNDVFGILDYMFEFLFSTTNFGEESEINDKEIKSYLSNAGFDNENIENALSYLSNIAVQSESKEHINAPSTNSFRIYSDSEQQKLCTKSLNLLITLEHNKKLTAQNRELIIDQIMSLPYKSSFAEFRWLAITVIMNADNKDLEQLINDADYNEAFNIRH